MPPPNQQNRAQSAPPKAPINALATVTDRAIAVESDEEARRLLFRQTYFKDWTDLEFELLVAEAAQRDLSPFRKEYAGIKFGDTVTYFPTIHGIRTLAQRSNRLEGIEKQWCGPDGKWRDIWLELTNPVGARALVYVKGSARPFVGIATWTERKREYWNSKTNKRELMDAWAKQPAHMLAKCAERDALAMSGLLSDPTLLTDMALDYDDMPPAIAGESEPSPYDGRTGALRHAHHAAALAPGRTMAAHDLVRDTARAIKPDLVSLKDADDALLNSTAEALEAFGADAPRVVLYDPESGEEVDPDTGDPLMSPGEEWAIQVDDVMSAQTTANLAQLRELCNGEAWKWARMIAHPKLSGNLAQKYVDLGTKATGDADSMERAFAARADARQVIAAGREAKAQAAINDVNQNRPAQEPLMK